MSTEAPLRSGYGVVAKTLHWLTFLVLVAQFLLGYVMQDLAEAIFPRADSSGHGSGRPEDELVFTHGWLGAGIVGLAVLRLGWRWIRGLPPWAEQLSALDRRIEQTVERVMYAAMFLIPATGAALLFASGEERETVGDRQWEPPWDVVDDDLFVALHVAGHLCFYAALAVHVGLAVRRGTWRRMAGS